MPYKYKTWWYPSPAADARYRVDQHIQLLCEFICHLQGATYWSNSNRCELQKSDITSGNIRMWAQLRRAFMIHNYCRPIENPVLPIFSLIAEAEGDEPSYRNILAAERDLLNAVGSAARLEGKQQKLVEKRYR